MYKLSIIVANKYGVLSRIAGAFSKRGYNIESFHADPIKGNESFTEIFITLRGDEIIISQIVKQINKLHDVKEVKVC